MTGGPSVRRTARTEQVILVALVAMVVVPVLGAGVRLAAEGWFPTFDDAVIANRSFDVFTRHTPLVGQFSLAGSQGPPTHSPGPMLFWYSAVSVRGPVWAIPVFVSVVNAASFAGSILLARRRGGIGLAAVVALGCLALVRSLGPVTMAEVWNPWIGLVPLVLLVFLVWSVLDGDRRLLPLAVLVGSFTLQGHLSLLFPSLALLAVAVLGGWIVPLVRRRAVPGGWRPVLLSIPVGVLCWVLPVYQELTTDPGNLTLLARSGGEPGGRGGVLAVKATLWRSLGVPPTWLQGEPDPIHFASLSFVPVGWPQVVQTVAVLGLLAWVGLLAVRAHDRLVATLVAVASALVAGMVATAFTIPLDRGLVAGYTFRWFTIASFVVWLAIGLGIWRLLLVPTWRTRPSAAGAVDPAGPPRRSTRWLGSPVVWSAGALLLGVAALALPWKDQFAFSYEPGRELGAVVVDATEPGGTYLVGRSGRWDLGFTPVVGHELRKAGRHPVMMRTRIQAFGEHYAPRGERCDGVIVLQEPGDAPDPGARRLAEIDVPGSGYLGDRMIVSLAPDDSADGQC
jgi:hypothetical protein